MIQYPDFTPYNYQIIRELGRNREGGRISYLAKSLDSEQQVAIKQFRFVEEGASWQGFKAHEREISILQELNHPRIPRYLDSFETQDGFCLVQEYKDAPSLATKNSFVPEAIKQIIISILEILVAIQNRVPPIIHRDIKPENILVDLENNAYLIDFGLARVNSQEVALSSIVAGTPGFMPPEELFNRPLTTASDLYSVGVTAIALLTNTPSVKISHLIDENYQFNFRHLITGINPDFLDWLHKMVKPNLKERYPNAATALQALKALEAIDIQGQFNQIELNFQKLKSFVILGSIVTSIGIFVNLNVESYHNPLEATFIKDNNSSISAEQQWFNTIKPRCNSVEVTTTMAQTTYLKTPEGIGYAASCYALAGKIELADKVIQELPPELRENAAEIVFNIGHPIADAGDDLSAGNIMDLVLKYWTDNYMALYHAGMSAYVLGEYSKAEKHLQEFMLIYQANDIWTNQAKLTLNRIEQNIPADSSFYIPN
jgi:serine/threonine protein kinase